MPSARRCIDHLLYVPFSKPQVQDCALTNALSSLRLQGIHEYQRKYYSQPVKPDWKPDLWQDKKQSKHSPSRYRQ